MADPAASAQSLDKLMTDAITLDPALFARVKVLYDKRDALGLARAAAARTR